MTSRWHEVGSIHVVGFTRYQRNLSFADHSAGINIRMRRMAPVNIAKCSKPTSSQRLMGLSHFLNSKVFFWPSGASNGKDTWVVMPLDRFGVI